MNYTQHSHSSGSVIPITVFSAVLTSISVTVAILYFTGNLLPKNDAAATAGEEEPGQETATVETPSLKGLTPEVAGDVLRAKGLRLVVQEERPDNSVPNGKICDQEPLPNSMLNAGGAVMVVVSTGTSGVAVPDVIGKPLEEAKVALVGAGFKIGDVTESETGTPGTVAETKPEKGATQPPGTSVDIVVTKAVTVPDVVGKYRNRAKKDLAEVGLTVGKIKWGDTDAKDVNVVLKQEPEAGAVVLPGAEIILTVNSD